MKFKSPIIPIVIASVLAVGGLAASFWFNSALVPPRERLFRQIDEEVEKAQRMLAGYNPAASAMLLKLEGPSTAPEAPPATEPHEAEPPADRAAERVNPFKEVLQQQNNRLNELNRGLTRLGAPAPRPIISPESVEAFRGNLAKNEALLKEALAIVQGAIHLTVQAGGESYSGDMHPSATCLETMLIYHQADLLNRQAGAYRAAADGQRGQFFQIAEAWLGVDIKLRSLQRSIDSSEPVQSSPTQPGGEAAAKVRRKSGQGGAISRWLKGAFRGPGGPGGPPGGPEQIPSAERPGPPPPSAGEPRSVPVVEPVEPSEIVKRKLPTIRQRIEKLQKDREELRAQIDQARRQVERYKGSAEELQRQIEAHKAKAAEAEQRMLALEQTGIEPADPQSLKTFMERYRQAAEENRRAWREASILENGAIRNARPDTDDDEQLLTAPLAPIDPARQLQPVRGLTAVQGDLQAAQALLEASEKLLAEMDGQIERLSQMHKDVDDALAAMHKTRENLKKEAGQRAKAAVALIAKADELENQAIALVEKAGWPAARRAKHAAGEQANRIRAFVNSQNKADQPNADLNKLANDRSLSGHATVLEADLQYLLATMQAQRAADGRRQEQLLALAARMGLAGERDLLPDGVDKENVPPYAYDRQAAVDVAGQSLAKAREAAAKALDIYQSADGDLKQLWVLHANMAAVQHLLARLSDQPQQAEQFRRQALEQYQLSLQDRDARPEAPVYKRMVEQLQAQTK